MEIELPDKEDQVRHRKIAGHFGALNCALARVSEELLKDSIGHRCSITPRDCEGIDSPPQVFGEYAEPRVWAKRIKGVSDHEIKKQRVSVATCLFQSL